MLSINICLVIRLFIVHSIYLVDNFIDICNYMLYFLGQLSIFKSL